MKNLPILAAVLLFASTLAAQEPLTPASIRAAVPGVSEQFIYEQLNTTPPPTIEQVKMNWLLQQKPAAPPTPDDWKTFYTVIMFIVGYIVNKVRERYNPPPATVDQTQLKQAMKEGIAGHVLIPSMMPRLAPGQGMPPGAFAAPLSPPAPPAEQQ
jgi:hypothetical protein